MRGNLRKSCYSSQYHLAPTWDDVQWFCTSKSENKYFSNYFPSLEQPSSWDLLPTNSNPGQHPAKSPHYVEALLDWAGPATPRSSGTVASRGALAKWHFFLNIWLPSTNVLTFHSLVHMGIIEDYLILNFVWHII